MSNSIVPFQPHWEYTLDDWDDDIGLSHQMMLGLSEFFPRWIDFVHFLTDNYPVTSFRFDLRDKTTTLSYDSQKALEKKLPIAKITIIMEGLEDQASEIELTEDFDLIKCHEIKEKKNEYLRYKVELLRNQEESLSKKKKRQNKEFSFESKLQAFLEVNDIYVERQTTAQGKRLDLWIPGQLIVEVKAGRITGDDICQAIDYLVTFERDVLLIGTGLSSSASRGIESINKISHLAKLLFVNQEASFGYLKSVLAKSTDI